MMPIFLSKGSEMIIDFSLSDFLDGALSAEDFDHAAHVKAGFALLGCTDFASAAAQYSKAIQTMATAAGAPEKFHMTITVAMLALIAERRVEGEQNDYRSFAAQNPELFDAGLLSHYYSNERLGSQQARTTFLLPDLV